MVGPFEYRWRAPETLISVEDYRKQMDAEAHPPQGPMLNFYLWGGYLNWRDPSVKIFLDSRVDIFEYTGVLRDYLDLLALKQPESLLDKYRIRYVLFPPGEPLTYVLEHDAGWKVLYRDKISVLLERQNGS